MTEPRTARLPRSARRAQLLDAASDVFTTKGYHASAMDDIAVAAGVSKPVLYQHFGSKLDLYLALVDQACDELIERVSDAMSSTAKNSDRVVATMDAFYGYVSNSSKQFRFVFESDLTGELQVRDRIWRVHQVLSDKVAQMIADDTGLPHDQAKLLAISLVGIAEVSARYWVTNKSDISREQATQLAATLAWRGIRGFPRTEQADAPANG